MKTTVAALQFSMSDKYEENIAKADSMIEKAAKEGAQIILLPELFERFYFCQIEDYGHFSFAEEFETSKTIAHFREIAKRLSVVLPVSYFEKAGNVFFNSIAIIDADGTVLGQYRKSHIPTGQCYEEKFYFAPGDTGFRVWKTRFGVIGVGICWDQWFSETARCLALNGAEILLYPTAIGSEPILDTDSMPHWRRVMQGHSAANLMPVVAANRIGLESVEPCEANAGQKSSLLFYGSSFMTDGTGALLQDASRDKEEILYAEYDLDQLAEDRLSWGLFRDRRPECYGKIAD